MAALSGGRRGSCHERPAGRGVVNGRLHVRKRDSGVLEPVCRRGDRRTRFGRGEGWNPSRGSHRRAGRETESELAGC